MGLVGYLQVLIGNDKDYLTTHVSYKLEPATGRASACSRRARRPSSAIALACQSLQQGECDMALAGGVCVRVPQKAGYHHEPGGIYSPDGHCRVFDAAARGRRVRKRRGRRAAEAARRDALADRDTIHAVIRGSAINNDGAAKTSYTAPGLDGQTEVIAAAHRAARASPGTIRLRRGARNRHGARRSRSRSRR